MRDPRILAAALAASGLALAAAWREVPDSALDGLAFDRLAPVPARAGALAIPITAADRERFPRFSAQPGRWPWSRLAHAGLLHALQSLGVRSVAVALFFDRPGEPEGDRGLARELETARTPVFLAAYQAPDSGGRPARPPPAGLGAGLPAALAAGLSPLEFGALQPPLPELAAAATGIGLANLASPGPDRTRGVPLVYRCGDRLLPSLALASALAARGAAAAEVRFEAGPVLVAGPLRIPLTRQGLALMSLVRVPEASVGKVFEALSLDPRPQAPFLGALAFVGLDDPALASPFPTARGDALPACQLEAAAAEAILGGGVVAPLARGPVLALVWSWLALASLAAGGALRARPIGSGLVLAAGPPGLALGALGCGLWVSTGAVLAASLAGALVLAGSSLVARLVTQKAREAEMAQAEQVTRSLLPRSLPPGLAGRLRPARVAAGDWFDAWELPDGARMLASVDVSGKGLDAAVLAGQIRAALKASTALPGGPAALLARLNELLEPDLTATGRLASAMLVRLGADGRFEVAAAGHPPLWLAGPDGGLVELPVPGKPLGYRPGTSFRSRTGTVPPGGFLVLVSDGIDELPEPGPRARLAAALASGPRTPAALVDAVLGPEAPPADDQTVLLAAGPPHPAAS